MAVKQLRKSRREYPFAMIPVALIRSKLSRNAKVLYMALMSHADNDTGEAFPSYTTLAEETGLQRRDIVTALHDLINARWLEKRRRFSESNYYTVAIEKPFASSITVETTDSITVETTDSINGATLTRPTNLDSLSRLSASAPKQAGAHDAFCLPSDDRTRRMIANAKVSDESLRQTMLDFHALFPDITYQATQWKAGARTLRDSYGGDLALLKAGADLARKTDKLPSYPGGLVWAVDRAKAAHRVLCEATTVDESIDAQGNAIYRVQS